MNLIFRITSWFVLVSLLVFLAGGVISFNVMMREVNFEQQRFLLERLDRMKDRLEKRPVSDTSRWNKMEVIPLKQITEESISFSDTVVMHSQLDRLEPHLRLDAIATIDGRSYSISLYDIIVEADDIRDGLVESLVTMYLLLLGAVIVIAFLASYVILRPFNQTLDSIKNFSLSNPNRTTQFPISGIREFKRLNEFLTEMTQKVQSDYQSLKEFSENASHEIQTPIAIVQSKLEMLMNGENLTEEQLQQLSFAQYTIKRLSNLGQSLALLTKIDNREFDDVVEVDLSSIVKHLLKEFQELIQLKSIKLNSDIEEGVNILADHVLIELLLTNLINNAIRHNWEGGDINLTLTTKRLIVENTGPKLQIPSDQLFRRFKKSNQSETSMGLGLAIVKKICDFYDYEIQYVNTTEIHTIQIDF